jgi:hypothetical protein
MPDSELQYIRVEDIKYAQVVYVGASELVNEVGLRYVEFNISIREMRTTLLRVD